MAHLEMIEGFATGRQFALGDSVLLGRGADNDICLPEGRVSRQHARIVRKSDATFFLEDLSSANGVYLRKERITPTTPYALQDGDEIGIGASRFVFYADLPHRATPRSRPASGQFLSNTTTGISLVSQVRGAVTPVTLIDEDTQSQQVTMMFDASSVTLDVGQVGQEIEQTTQELRETVKRLRAMCQVSTALGAITGREELVHKIIDCVFEIFPAAERAVLMLCDPNTNDLLPVASRTWQETPGSQKVVLIPRTIINEVMTHKRSILSLDALDDKRFSDHTSVFNLSIRSIMCVPLVFREEIFGLIHVDTRTRTHNFTSEDLQMLTGMAAQAAIAIKTLQLYEAIEAESARRTSLQRYFSPPLVEMLMSGDFTTELGGTPYRGTILFSDIVGFTAMSEHVAPTQIVTNLNRYFTIMQKVIYEHRGNVDKFGGDAIMAFWGVPHSEVYDEHDAVLTAIRMQEKLWPFNLEMSLEGQQPIYMGLGLHSGEFIAGNIGSEDKIEFTLIGPTVNLAARIERLAGRYQVFVSAETWQSIRHLVCAVQLPPVLIKGKTQPVTIYSIRAIQDRFQGGYAMALPCHVYNGQGRHVGRGMISRVQHVDAHFILQFNTNRSLSPGATFTLRCLIPEHHELIALRATVDKAVSINDGTSCPYTQATLYATTANDVTRAFLSPGGCLRTARTWEDLERL